MSPHLKEGEAEKLEDFLICTGEDNPIFFKFTEKQIEDMGDAYDPDIDGQINAEIVAYQKKELLQQTILQLLFQLLY